MIGNIIGNYRIMRKVGEGGMGAVYMARDLSLERDVAIKIIAPELARNPGLMARFRIEAIAQAKLNHTNIVTIHSFNQEKDLYFIVMEFVEGSTLKEFIKTNGKIPMVQALKIFSQILDAIATAHAKGIVHRDIKPANIFITPQQTAKVGDFGIAKVEGIDGLTKIGTTMGSPVYSSPEQLMGQKIDARTDVYSLGITFYEMITGTLPIITDGQSDYHVLKQVIEVVPPKPSVLNPEIPASIDAVIMKSIEKDASKRYQTVNEFIDAIRQLVPSLAATPGISDQKPRPIPSKKDNDKKKIILAGGLAAALLIVVIILLAGGSSKSPITPVHSGSNRQAGPVPGADQGGSQDSSGSLLVKTNPEQPGTTPNTPTTNPTNPTTPTTQPKTQPDTTGNPTGPKTTPSVSLSTSPQPDAINPVEVPKRMHALTRRGYFYKAIELGEASIKSGNTSGDVYFRMAEAYFYAGKKDIARPLYFKALNGNSHILFPVTYRLKKGEVNGSLSINRSALSFNPNGGGSSFDFSIPLSQLKSITEDLAADIVDIFKKKKNRRNPLIVFKDSKKNKYTIEVANDDNTLRSFIVDIIETFKSKG